MKFQVVLKKRPLSGYLHFILYCVCMCVLAVFSPLLRLSPPPSEKDYYFNLDENEGVCDLFDIPL